MLIHWARLSRAQHWKHAKNHAFAGNDRVWPLLSVARVDRAAAYYSHTNQVLEPMMHTVEMTGVRTTRSANRFYFVAAISLLFITLWGFSATYFAPLLNKTSAFGGRVTDLPMIVHVHGWSFFLWYLLLVTQAGLIHRRSVRLHRRLGAVSVVLAAIMVLSGIITITYNVHLTMDRNGPPIWSTGGLAIFATLVLFVVFYGQGIKHRTQPEVHKRLMLMAGIPALGAAVGRILFVAFAPQPMNIPAGILLTNLLIFAAMIYDKTAIGSVHEVYWKGLAVCLFTETLALALPYLAPGEHVLASFAFIGRHLSMFYG
jgi:hypothetical protein